MSIPISEIKAVCEVYEDVYDVCIDDFEKILKVEQVVFPLLLERQNETAKKKEKIKDSGIVNKRTTKR